MIKVLGAAAAVAASTLLSGCAANSLPSARGFIHPLPAECPPTRICGKPHVSHVFADANGTFYPAGWTDRVAESRIRRHHSLYNATAPGSPERDFIAEGERRLLGEIAGLQAAGGRIFIFVHGYNNKVAEADDGFDLLETKLDLRPQDRIIRFYWDGLTGTGVGAARIWFRAVANSQLVGSRALRRVLERFHDRDIYLIGHSRGTSVILSALGNPVYDPDFLARTEKLAREWGIDPETFLRPPPLATNGNRIRVLAAAPAVDRIDFCEAAAQPLAGAKRFLCPTERLRPLPVERFRYTINRKDPVLNKLVGLSAHLNPTGLGVGREAGEPPLRCHYGARMQAHVLPPFRKHSFKSYLRRPGFLAILAAEGIARPGVAPAVAGEANC